jgi:hypothetical protein
MDTIEYMQKEFILVGKDLPGESGLITTVYLAKKKRGYDKPRDYQMADVLKIELASREIQFKPIHLQKICKYLDPEFINPEKDKPELLMKAIAEFPVDEIRKLFRLFS